MQTSELHSFHSFTWSICVPCQSRELKSINPLTWRLSFNCLIIRNKLPLQPLTIKQILKWAVPDRQVCEAAVHFHSTTHMMENLCLLLLHGGSGKASWKQTCVLKSRTKTGKGRISTLLKILWFRQVTSFPPYKKGLTSTWIFMSENSPKNELHCMQTGKQTKWHVQLT